MDKRFKGSGTVLAKARLKDLCREDKEKLGHLMNKLAEEKQGKIKLEGRVEDLKAEMRNMRSERDMALRQVEMMKKKLEDCLNLMQKIPRINKADTSDVGIQVKHIEENERSFSLDKLINLPLQKAKENKQKFKEDRSEPNLMQIEETVIDQNEETYDEKLYEIIEVMEMEEKALSHLDDPMLANLIEELESM